VISPFALSIDAGSTTLAPLVVPVSCVPALPPPVSPSTALGAACEAGFGSYAQFYRVFREETGRNPSALRTAAVDEELGVGP